MLLYIDFETSLDAEVTRKTAFFLAYDIDPTTEQEVFRFYAVPSITESVRLQQMLTKTVKMYWPMSNKLLSSDNDALDENLIFPHGSLTDQPLTRNDIENSFPGHLLKLELFGEALRQQAQKQSQMSEFGRVIVEGKQSSEAVKRGKKSLDRSTDLVDGAWQTTGNLTESVGEVARELDDLKEWIRRPKQENSDFTVNFIVDFSFILKVACMWEVQLAAIALGTLVLLAFNGAGAVALGVGLITVGVAGYVASFFSSDVADASDRSECSSPLSVDSVDI